MGLFARSRGGFSGSGSSKPDPSFSPTTPGSSPPSTIIEKKRANEVNFCFSAVIRNKFLESIEYLIQVRGCSQFAMTSFCLFFLPPPSWHFLPFERWQKINLFRNTYLLLLVNVVWKEMAKCFFQLSNCEILGQATRPSAQNKGNGRPATPTGWTRGQRR